MHMVTITLVMLKCDAKISNAFKSSLFLENCL